MSLMTIDSTLQNMNAAIEKYDLLQSKFYQAWSAGTLPRSALKTYAREYGAYIAQVPYGWSRHGDNITAGVESTHLELWKDFAKGLETEVGSPTNPGVQKLIDITKKYFSSPAESIGALYAFEVQQPKTSRSKLEGLKAHYAMEKEAQVYFEVHVDDVDEVELLEKRLEKLSAEDRKLAEEACRVSAQALREALDSLYEAEVGDCTTCH